MGINRCTVSIRPQVTQYYCIHFTFICIYIDLCKYAQYNLYMQLQQPPTAYTPVLESTVQFMKQQMQHHIIAKRKHSRLVLPSNTYSYIYRKEIYLSIMHLSILTQNTVEAPLPFFDRCTFEDNSIIIQLSTSDKRLHKKSKPDMV